LRRLACLSLLALAACGQGDDHAAQRIVLDDLAVRASQPLPSPDVAGALWAEQPGGALTFGKPGAQPLLTLACSGATAHITRHAPAEPAAKALFALIGNGTVARIKADESEGEWLSVLRAQDSALRVFVGSGPVAATLAGAGTLNLAGSPLPGQLLARCRQPG
jgi:hypothetical protein